MRGRPSRRARALALSALVACEASPDAARGGPPTIDVDGTAFRVTLPDGHVLTPAELVGVVLTVRDEADAWRRMRIDGVELDPKDPAITLYSVTTEDPATGTWGPLCTDPSGAAALAMPLVGAWTADGRHERRPGAFNMTCTSGAIGKCVRLGYKPWARAPAGGDLWDLHQACVRMLRGDYCGDGTGFTNLGQPVMIADRLAIQRIADDPPFPLEAAWGPEGALCVHHPRVPENVDLAALVARCPERLAGRTGEACRPETFINDPRHLLRNHSPAP